MTVVKAWNYHTDSRAVDIPRGECRHCGDRCREWTCVTCAAPIADQCPACHA